MSYLTYLFDLILAIMLSIKIPIPIYIGSGPLYLSVFTIFLGLFTLGIILYFLTRLLRVGNNLFWHDVSSGLVKDFSKQKYDFNEKNNYSNNGGYSKK